MGLKSYDNFLRGGNIIEPSYDNFLKQTARRDPYFNLTSLLLHGDGTNATQNNTFLDSSTNNFTITRNGNPTQGTISPYGNNWSNYFDGSGDTLSTTAVNISSGDFTIESWVYLNAMPTTDSWPGSYSNWMEIIGVGSTNLGDGWQFRIGQTVLAFGTNGDTTAVSATHGMSANTWYHLACVRSGNTYTLYVNGSSIGSATYTANAPGTGAFTWIGSETNQGAYLNGYISNLRLVTRALYTSNFTPPTSPLTAVANTSLLTCQSNRLVDNSSNNFTITRNGDVSVQKFSPFSPTSAYSSGSFGGSGYFDGTGDYLTIANNTAFNLSGTTYTIEGWINPNGDYSNYRTIIAKRSGDTAATNSWEVYLRISSGVLSFYNGTNYESSVTPTANAWNYFAAVFDGTNINLYLNGSRVLQSAITNADTNATIYVGSYPTYSENFIGYISDLKITKGSALYSGTTMSVPTSPLTSSDNTSLLLNFTNAAIRDNTSFNNLETVGNAQISTTQSKFGGSSLYFDGTGDWLIAPSSSNCSFETGDFTIECWLYPTVITGTDRCIWETRSASTDAGLVLFINTNGKLSTFTSNALRLTSTNSLTVNTWQHFALVRSSGTLAFYINGVQNGTLAYTTAITCPGLVRIGVRQDGLQPYTGYIDDLRITKGLARYTTNFTPPTEPFLDL